jgi:phosphoribosylcarboxyaminoimidazole (NCAIR) mutase
VSLGRSGATNAAVLAAQILGVSDVQIATRLEEYKRRLAEKVEQAAARLGEGPR